ncbi:hypothetical protein fHeYen901_251 [Yersinia phage fHe-Yen9-01]|uniref:GIY-YIG domain-containing protein n=1 Tax=Yersinia phage fHe-Yen9-01 TaxID=1965363 RepID=A0A1V0DXZ8_9CAUD|nr:homing endonuclease [Yersinia phage fHe-Yen9-01]ARB06024.1 hypothetical protein fHeYen901_251 [Yersinia phage fHe-Yen9-01]
MIIYKTTNTINRKIYIGKSIKNDPRYLGSGTLITKAINKYGKENFSKEIITSINDLNTLNYLEKFFISVFNSKNKKIGYNIAGGGDGGDIISFMPNCAEIRRRCAQGLKRWNSNPENLPKRKNINLNISKALSHTAEERGASIAKAKKKYELVGPKKPRHTEPKKQSQSHRENLSKALIGNKPVNCVKIEVDGVEFESLNDASSKLDIKLSTLRHRIRSLNYPTYIRKDL